MIYVLDIFIGIVASFLTISFFPYFRIFGVVPLLPLFFLIPLAYFRKGVEPFLLAAFLGIFFDIFTITPFGFYLSFYILVALILRYLFQEGMRHLSFGLYLALVLLFLLVYHLAQIGVIYFSEIEISLSSLSPIFISILVNLFFAIMLYVPVEWFFDWQKRLENVLKRR